MTIKMPRSLIRTAAEQLWGPRCLQRVFVEGACQSLHPCVSWGSCGSQRARNRSWNSSQWVLCSFSRDEPSHPWIQLSTCFPLALIPPRHLRQRVLTSLTYIKGLDVLNTWLSCQFFLLLVDGLLDDGLWVLLWLEETAHTCVHVKKIYIS